MHSGRLAMLSVRMRTQAKTAVRRSAVSGVTLTPASVMPARPSHSASTGSRGFAIMMVARFSSARSSSTRLPRGHGAGIGDEHAGGHDEQAAGDDARWPVDAADAG